MNADSLPVVADRPFHQVVTSLEWLVRSDTGLIIYEYFSAIADIEAGCGERPQPGGLVTLAASRGRTPTGSVSELTLTTLYSRSDCPDVDGCCRSVSDI